MKICNKYKLKASSLCFSVLAFSNSTSAALIYDDPNTDYEPVGSVMPGSGESVIRAAIVNLSGGISISSQDCDGSLDVQAGSLSGFRYVASMGENNKKSLSYSTEFSIAGSTSFQKGISLQINKSPTNLARIENSLHIQTKSLEVYGDGSAISAQLGYEGGDDITNSLVRFQAEADVIEAIGGSMQAIYADGGYVPASDDEGTHVALTAQTIMLSGGGSYGGTYAANIAVYASQGAHIKLTGRDEASLTINTKQNNVSSDSDFGNFSLYAKKSAIEVAYGEKSQIHLQGGLFAMGNDSNVTLRAGQQSDFMLDGNILAVEGNVNVNVTGHTTIHSPTIMAQSGAVNLYIDSGDEQAQPTVVNGNMTAVYGTSVLPSIIDVKLTGQQAILIGTAEAVDDPDSNAVNIELNNGAKWDVQPLENGNNRVTALTLNEGILNLGTVEEGSYKILEADSLAGSGGTIRFGLTLTNSQEDNDQLIIANASTGNHIVHVDVHQGFEPKDMLGYLISMRPDQTAVFTADDNKLEAGVYLYSYKTESRINKSTGTKEWYIVFDESDPSESGELSPSGEAVVAMAGMGAQNAAYLLQLSDLRKRLGEVRSMAADGLWVSVGGQKDRLSGFRGTNFEQEAYRFNFGFDRQVGDWVVGANFKATMGDQTTKNTVYQADGNSHSEGVNLYAAYVPANGSYADLVLSVDRYHQDIDARMLNGVNADGSYSNFGFGASVEIGHQFHFGDAWFVEPQAQLAYHHLEGDNFRLTNGMKVMQDDFNGMTARLGVAAGKTFLDAGGDYHGQLYGTFGVRHELLGEEGILVNDVRFEDKILGTRVYYGLAFDRPVSKAVKFYGWIEREEGAGYTKSIDANIGVRWCF